MPDMDDYLYADEVVAARMADHLVVDETEAFAALEEGRLVFALAPNGWVQVENLYRFRDGESIGVQFEGGYERVFQPGGTFWVERRREAG
jgi:hypothetical protein